ncbi:hypothetical protein roselon_01699 [Roseibacterium elongatum DSM 19469]|uniref:Uncharacterized protein n=1 Tax=Roseicyclus elongatus DSM 19469 TaxID=1294273 RepID=W8S5G4_9RHOB|nr:hypothetical protein [Roseibacterium elongatum]AHM04071.1 hypothetical protein roselon_01699 [Roseibacterium elongatum DSM 19469]
MSVPNSEDILAVAKENVAAFIRDQTSARALSPMIRHLNDDLLSGDQAAREMAARALAHLGFVERA